MKISVHPGDVMVASVNVRRHSGGIYTVQIQTPHDPRPGIVFGCSAKSGTSLTSDVFLHNVFLYSRDGYKEHTRVNLAPESNDEEEALMNGLFDVLDDYSRYAVTLIAIPASLLEEAEEAGTWEPQGSIDYLQT